MRVYRDPLSPREEHTHTCAPRARSARSARARTHAITVCERVVLVERVCSVCRGRRPGPPTPYMCAPARESNCWCCEGD